MMPDRAAIQAEDRPPKRRQYLAELIVGIAIAAALLWVAVASNQSVPFVYQGL